MGRILLGVSGGIAAYKGLEFVRLATAGGHSVRVLQTPASRRFVGSASFSGLTGAPVLVSEFQRDPLRGVFPGQEPPAHDPIGHLAVVENADAYLIAPASANTIAKFAAGLADSMVTSCALAARCPLLVAPAMNSAMYEHPATQANLALLRERGVRVIDPGEGRLASKGEHGVGRLAEPAELLAACEAALAGSESSLAGLTVLVTAGGTREPIDSVRYIGNNSSGRMGMALAEAAHRRGAAVTLVAANVSLPGPHGVARIDVRTAAELGEACEREFERCDVLLMAAAVADFAPSQEAAGKIKKEGREGLALELSATADVLGGLSRRRRPGQTLVGFAAEHGERALEQGRRKLAGKGLDAVVVNDISRTDIGFDSTHNEVTIVTAANGSPEAEHHVARAGKELVAAAILDTVEGLRKAH